MGLALKSLTLKQVNPIHKKVAIKFFVKMMCSCIASVNKLIHFQVPLGISQDKKLDLNVNMVRIDFFHVLGGIGKLCIKDLHSRIRESKKSNTVGLGTK